MIRVTAQPEPADFDRKVRQRGLAHLNRRNILLHQPLPPKAKIQPYWRDCLDDLYQVYQGTCAYLCVHFERVIGGGSVDHFIAKSQSADQAYEWGNYRLACRSMNSRKLEYDDVLDPFTIRTGWFQLELVSGRIYPKPRLQAATRIKVEKTIERLGLDDAGNREMRARHYQYYCQGRYPADFLKEHSPFVWFEADRQGLL
ncbi:MAG: hypothetical protein SF339_09590 [Blastocatellia bacterium]|nr:hypothetical protein [Blastocatellia bacterium]